jgi:hypothetical protein
MFLETYGPCIAACYACATVGECCAIACLEDGHELPMSRGISIDMDCA